MSIIQTRYRNGDEMSTEEAGAPPRGKHAVVPSLQ
jgi:hypothetical protein